MNDTDRLIATLLARIEELEALVKQQAARIAELEKRLNKNSRNSSKPPSSDGLGKPPRTTSLRENGKNKSGGQKGHKGETLKQAAHPDKIIRHALQLCPACGLSLNNQPVLDIAKRQVFDIPAPKVEVTEHQTESKYCSCCNKVVSGLFPETVSSPAQYGSAIRSWAVYYQNQHFIPEDRLQQLFADMYGVSLATATLANCNTAAFDALSGFEEAALSMAKKAAVKHLDETGFRVAGKTQWLHTLSTKTLTYYHVSHKRKSLLDGLTGIVVHDHWRPYYQLENVEHALCNQHHLRELKALIEHEKEEWATRMSRFLRLALRYRHWCGKHPIPIHRLNQFDKIYERIVNDGLNFHQSLPPLPFQKKRGKKKQRTGHNLLLRLKHYKQDVLRFLYNPDSPFTNNDAERDLRMVKCKQKISGGFRTSRGADQFARIRGFISTARKQGWNILDSIQTIFHQDWPIPMPE
jgi:transposase